ncbi:MAG: hypothetical protein AUJ71_00175 [Candidatus Omnitrophica bacterium CG1_02_49_16]|nr:MAG: hypothetical protein AUJ71_00175 [Candidatus Omnitrophica bacterium CG1_02_49_16]
MIPPQPLLKNRLRQFILPTIIFFLFPSGVFAESIKNSDCLECHTDFHTEKFASSVHADNLCTSCHKDIQEIPHPEKLAKVDCGSCHRIEGEVYRASDHGKALSSGIQAASCLDCHVGDPHAIVSHRNVESPVYRLNIPKTCAVCHEDQKKMSTYHLLENAPLKSYSLTIHGKALQSGLMSAAVCTDCHGSHDLHAPTNPLSKIYRKNVPVTCGKCHENVLMTYERSVHGKAAMSGKVEAPVCTDCHGEHTIRSHRDPMSRVYASSVSEKVCSQCHAAEKIVSKYRLPGDRLKTYLESYHGLAGKMGSTVVANCASCHGVHDILPSSDSRSLVNKKNLPRTCGKCHPNVSEQLAKGSVHVSAQMSRDLIIYIVTLFYTGLILFVIGGMLLHNLLDFLRKFSEIYRCRRAQKGSLRFTMNERIQHAVLFVSFTVLAYSGFALKYSEAWWAAPFTLFNFGFDLRGAVHRTAAFVFTTLCFYHLWFLLCTPRGREQLRALRPVMKDLTDFIGMMRYYVGLSKKRPKFEHYGYVEKAEYWALIWGSAIMIATGGLLTFENLAMRYFPKWLMDVAMTIHFFEAVLATLAILVWHFYFTIFDPEQYPMHMSILTGKEAEHEKTVDEGEKDGEKE